MTTTRTLFGISLAAIAVVLVLFVLGLALLASVDEEEGVAAAGRSEV